MHIEAFNTEKDNDYLDIYDGENANEINRIKILSGNLSRSFLSEDILSAGHSLFLAFHSNENNQSRGFYITYSLIGNIAIFS